MRRHFATALCVLLAASALGAPAHAAPRAKRVQVFLLPLNEASASMATRMSGNIEKALRKQQGLEVVDLTSMLGGKPGPEVDKAREKARGLLQKGQQHYSAVEFDAAVVVLEQALAVLREQASWLDSMPEYTEALAYLGASYILKGDQVPGRAVFKELALYKKSYRIDTTKMDASLEGFLEQAREEIQSGSVGSISVYSKPPGARVFIDGVERGFTPASIDRIPTGRHVLRLEQLGTLPYGDVVEVVPTDDRIVRAKLTTTEDFKKIRTVVGEVGREFERGKVGPAMIKLGQFVGLDLAVYGIVSHNFGETTLDAWVVNISAQRRVAARRDNFPDSEFNLANNAEDFVKQLMKEAATRNEKVTTTNDPLENSSGTDGWWDEGTKRERTLDVTETDVSGRGGGSDDPLDGADGTQDW